MPRIGLEEFSMHSSFKAKPPNANSPATLAGIQKAKPPRTPRAPREYGKELNQATQRARRKQVEPKLVCSVFLCAFAPLRETTLI
jgi:hypothetical protein